MTPREALEWELARGRNAPLRYQAPVRWSGVVAWLISLAVLAGVVWRLIDQWIDW